jgi:thymidylate synthase (FAD)
MKLIKPSYEILTEFNKESLLKDIEQAARTCYKSEDLIGSMIKCPRCKGTGTVQFQRTCADPEGTPALYDHECPRCKGAGELVSWEDLVQKLVDRNHEAMLEFGPSITVKFICDRGVSHEFVRHRLASFAQESTRYCNYGKDEHVQYIIPSWLDLEEGEYSVKNWDTLDPKIKNMSNVTNKKAYRWALHMLWSERMYNYLVNPLDNKWSAQEARSVLPNSLKTEINIKANLREWRHIFKMRVASAAHPQMRELMRPLLDEFKANIPIIFDDLTY